MVTPFSLCSGLVGGEIPVSTTSLASVESSSSLLTSNSLLGSVDDID